MQADLPMAGAQKIGRLTQRLAHPEGYNPSNICKFRAAKMSRCFALLLMTLFGLAQPAQAEKADRSKPLHAESDAMRHDELKQRTLFTGNVVMTKGTILLRAERVEVTQTPDGFQQASAQALVMVANEREGALMLGEIAKLPAAQRLPVVAHWGITGGTLHTLVGDALSKVDMQIIQTFTFIDNIRPAAQRLAVALMKEGGLASVREIFSPVGSAHAYDMTHLLALAINKAGSTQGDALRQALERLPAFDGAVRRYEPAFTPTRHDALTPREVLFVRMEPGGALMPVK